VRFRPGFLLLLALGSSLLAQRVSPATDGPAYVSSFPHFRYGGEVSSLREISFRNLKAHWFSGKRSDEGLDMRNGKAEQDWKTGGHERVTLDFVEFLNSVEGDARYALIGMEWHDCGGSCTVVGLIQVFELQSGHPTVVQQIEYDREAPGTGAKLDAGKKYLTVIGRSNDHTLHCCPSTVDIMRFEWDENKLTFKNSKTVLIADKP
jgi:hypothetical protein